MIEQAFRSLLLGDAAVAALVGDRVIYGAMPQRATFPRVQITKIDKTAGLTADAAGPAAVRVQVDCWARSIDGARALAAAVNGADDESTRGPLHGHSGTVAGLRVKLIELLVERAAEYEPDESPEKVLYRVSADYRAHL